jgi:hypothetical protein
VTELKAGQDFRRPELRREVFLRFYAWSVKYKSFPGGVHYALPYLADALELDLEQRYWLAWLNANTQNPVTSLLLLQAAPRLRDWRAAVDFWRAHYKLLDWDTDRRYHKARFEDALTGYASATDCSCTLPQHVYYRVGYEWGAWWERAYALPTMGRLSTWSSGARWVRRTCSAWSPLCARTRAGTNPTGATPVCTTTCSTTGWSRPRTGGVTGSACCGTRAGPLCPSVCALRISRTIRD